MENCEPCNKEGCEDCGCKQEQVVETDREKLEQTLNSINNNRTRGLKQLEHKVQLLLDSPMDVEHLGSADLVGTLRDVTQALNSTLLFAEAQNEIINMLINDLVGLAQKTQKLESNLFLTGSHLQALMRLLDDKGAITEDEMRLAWQKVQEGFVKQQAPEEML